MAVEPQKTGAAGAAPQPQQQPAQQAGAAGAAPQPQAGQQAGAAGAPQQQQGNQPANKPPAGQQGGADGAAKGPGQNQPLNKFENLPSGAPELSWTEVFDSEELPDLIDQETNSPRPWLTGRSIVILLCLFIITLVLVILLCFYLILLKMGFFSAATPSEIYT